MAGYRKNSFIIDFSVMPSRPMMNKVQAFLINEIRLDMSKIKNIQTSITKGQVIVEAESEMIAEELIALHNMQHTMEHDGKQYTIPILSSDNAIEVKVHDLPPHMPNAMIAKHLALYGEILTMKDDVWKDYFPGIPNGVRTVRMKLKKQIPSYVLIDGETAYVRYRNQTRTCRHCVRPLHIGRTCADARKDISHDINGRLTVAQVVQGITPPAILTASEEIPASSSNTPTTTETVEEHEKHNCLVTAITDRIMQTMVTAPSNRSSSTPRLRHYGSSQTAGPSKHTSQSATSQHSNTYEAETNKVNASSSKRPASPNLEEAAFSDVKRKSRSNKQFTKWK